MTFNIIYNKTGQVLLAHADAQTAADYCCVGLLEMLRAIEKHGKYQTDMFTILCESLA